MRFAEKLLDQMRAKGLNQQRLARISKVSDSEVSRIVTGKSNPGLENAFRLARAVEVSLDFLADDELQADPIHPSAVEFSHAERELLEVAEAIGHSQAGRILENVRIVGYETAMRRLLLDNPFDLVKGNGSRPASAEPSKVATRTSVG